MPPSLRTLYTRFGFDAAAADYCIDKQKLSTLDALSELEEEDVEHICKLCRKPGGTIPNPDFVALSAADKATYTGSRTISNPGIEVSLKEEGNLKLVCFFLRFKNMTSRSMAPAQVTVATVNTLRSYKKEVDKHENPSADLAPILSAKKLFDFFSDFRDFLHEHLGKISKRPLSYVIREHVAIPTGLDPGFGEPDTIYYNRMIEIEHRAPIETNGAPDSSYLQDNVAVWKLLWNSVKDTQYVTYVKSFVAKQDGHAAYQLLYDTLLGPQAVNNHASQAENRLAAMTLDGTRKKNWGFDKYVIAHKEQHLILDKLIKHGHTGVDENSKVRHFLKGISDPKLMSMINTISTLKTTTFDDVVSSFRSYIESAKIYDKGVIQPLNISQVNTGGTRYTRPHRAQNTSAKASPSDDNYKPGTDYSKSEIDVRYYKTKEWNALKPNQRNFLREQKRRSANKSVASNADLKRTIQALTAHIASVEASTASEDSAGDEQKPTKKLKSLKRGNSE